MSRLAGLGRCRMLNMISFLQGELGRHVTLRWQMILHFHILDVDVRVGGSWTSIHGQGRIIGRKWYAFSRERLTHRYRSSSNSEISARPGWKRKQRPRSCSHHHHQLISAHAFPSKSTPLTLFAKAAVVESGSLNRFTGRSLSSSRIAMNVSQPTRTQKCQ